MAKVGRWSVIGGESVPERIGVEERVVKIMSSRVAVFVCTGSYLVGVVIVV